jgi:hypothetical protein
VCLFPRKIKKRNGQKYFARVREGKLFFFFFFLLLFFFNIFVRVVGFKFWPALINQVRKFKRNNFENCFFNFVLNEKI